jgi:ubiquinone biosynthesis protein UbiJ
MIGPSASILGRLREIRSESPESYARQLAIVADIGCGSTDETYLDPRRTLEVLRTIDRIGSLRKRLKMLEERIERLEAQK